MLAKLPFTAPSVDPSLVASTGVTELRNVFTAEQMPGIIVAYMDGLKISYAVAIAATGAALIISLASKWRNLRGKVVLSGAA